MIDLNSIERAAKWAPNLDIIPPIIPEDIKEFSKWVLYGGFKFYHNSGRSDETHLGHDFISYLDDGEDEHFELQPQTPVRAIADGIVKSVITKSESRFRDYEMYIVLQHNEHGLASGYAHVVPSIRIGDKVKKGQVIATLYDTSSLYPGISLPTHLHLELGSSRMLNREYPYLNEFVDPIDVIPGLKAISVKSKSFFPNVR